MEFPDPKGDRRAFSITSSSQVNNEITIIFRESGSGFQKTLLSLPKDAKLQIKGPCGQSLVLTSDLAAKNICFIASGVGIAPFLSIIRSYDNLPVKPKITLVNLNYSPEREFYIEELKKYGSEGKINLVNFTGQFNLALLASLPDPKNTLYSICGPQDTTDDISQKLLVWGINRDQMRFEQFYPTPLKTLTGLSDLGSSKDSSFNLKSSAVLRSKLVQKIYAYYYSFILFIILVLAATYLLLDFSFPQTIILYVAFSLLSLNYLIFKFTKNLNYLLHSTLAITLIVLSWALWFGDLGGATIYWIYFFPVLTFFSLGKKLGVIWSTFYAVSVASIFILSINRFSPYYYGVNPAVLSFISLIFITVVSYLANYITEAVIAFLGEATSLRESYKLAIESSSNHIIITDPNGKILYANAAAQKVTGFSLPELLGNTPRLWGGLMDPKYYQQMWDVKKNQKQFFTSVAQNMRKNGETYTAIIHISPIIDPSGDLLGFVATEEDVSDREKLEESLKLKVDELSKLNKFMVGRELRMRELKKEITDLKKTKK